MSNDEKPDWVYSPKDRAETIRGIQKVVPNRDPAIRLADPRLVAEFHAVVGHREFHIVSLPVFIEGLSKVRSAGLENLASAIQVEVEKTVNERVGGETEQAVSTPSTGGDGGSLEQQTESESSADTSAVPTLQPTEVALATDASVSSVGEANLTAASADIVGVEQGVPIYPPEALRDSAYEIDEASELDVVIRELSSHNWYRQNPSVTQLRSLRDGKFTNGAWFVLGRNIYQAACGNAQKALEFVRDIDIQLARFPNDIANHILSGALFEVYFDGRGKFRTAPKSEQIDPLFKVSLNSQYSVATEFICEQLKPFASRLIAMPGNAERIELNIQLAQATGPSESAVSWTFASVNFAGHELLSPVPKQEHENYFSLTFLHERRWTLKSIASALSKNWVVPSWQIHTSVMPDVPSDTLLLVPEDKVLHVENLL